jgi:hypothetical protein
MPQTGNERLTSTAGIVSLGIGVIAPSRSLLGATPQFPCDRSHVGIFLTTIDVFVANFL